MIYKFNGFKGKVSWKFEVFVNLRKVDLNKVMNRKADYTLR